MAARLLHFRRRLTAPIHGSLGRTRSISTDSRVSAMNDRSTLAGGVLSSHCSYTAWISIKRGRELSNFLRKSEDSIIELDDEVWNAMENIRSIDPKQSPTELIPEQLRILRKIVTTSGERRDLVNAENFSKVEALPEKYRQDPIISEMQDGYEDSGAVHFESFQKPEPPMVKRCSIS